MSRRRLFLIGTSGESIDSLKNIFSKSYDCFISKDGTSDFDYVKENSEKISAIFFVHENIDIQIGLDFVQKLYDVDLARHFPIFLVTNEKDANFIQKAYMYGVTDVVRMPLNPIIIEQRTKNIVELFDNRRQMEQLFNDQSELISKQIIILQKNQWAIIETLGNALESRDVESGDHVSRVKHTTNKLARKLAVNHPEYMLNSAKIELITFASTLHDIGKIAIPDSILRKPETEGRLTDAEYEIMKTHTTEGCKVIDSIPDFKDSALYPYCYDICRHHHERWDGNGYPDKLEGNDIPIGAQLVSIADVYDALVNSRVYKPALTHEESCKMILEGKCGVFNPDLLECFEDVIDKIHDEHYAKNVSRL